MGFVRIETLRPPPTTLTTCDYRNRARVEVRFGGRFGFRGIERESSEFR